MSWKYETRCLNEIYRLLEDKDHQDYDILKDIARKALSVAKVFEEKINEDFIVKYLNDQLPYDALCEVGLIANVLHPCDISVEERIYSCSHSKWLNMLSRTKLHWTWKQSDVELKDTQKVKLEKVLDSYKELQELALSYAG